MAYDLEKIECIKKQFEFFDEKDQFLKIQKLKQYYGNKYERICDLINIDHEAKIINDVKKFILLMYLMDSPECFELATNTDLMSMLETIDDPSYHFDYYANDPSVKFSAINFYTNLSGEDERNSRPTKLRESIKEIKETQKLFFNKLCTINKKLSILTFEPAIAEYLNVYLQKLQAIIDTNQSLYLTLLSLNFDDSETSSISLGKILSNNMFNIDCYTDFYVKVDESKNNIHLAIKQAKPKIDQNMDQEYSNFFMNECVLTPMQQITRLPLLIKNTIKFIDNNSSELQDLENAYQIYNQACDKLNRYCGQQESLNLIKWLDENVKISPKIINKIIKDDVIYNKYNVYDMKEYKLNIADKTIFADDRIILDQLICFKGMSKKQIRIFLTRDLVIFIKFPADSPNAIPFVIKKVDSPICLYTKVYTINHVRMNGSSDDRFLEVSLGNRFIKLTVSSPSERNKFIDKLNVYSNQYKYDKIMLLRSNFDEINPPFILTINYIVVKWNKNFIPHLNLKLDASEVTMYSDSNKTLIFNEPTYFGMINPNELLTIRLIHTKDLSELNIGTTTINISYKSETDDFPQCSIQKIFSCIDSSLPITKLKISYNIMKNKLNV